MFDSSSRTVARGSRERRTTSEVVTSWLVRARLGPVPAGQLGKRRNRRWRWRGKLWVQLGADRFQVRTYDLSAGGASLVMPKRLDQGTVIRLQDGPDAPIIEARVMHVDEADRRGMFRTGVQFVVPDSSQNGSGP